MEWVATFRQADRWPQVSSSVRYRGTGESGSNPVVKKGGTTEYDKSMMLQHHRLGPGLTDNDKYPVVQDSSVSYEYTIFILLPSCVPFIFTFSLEQPWDPAQERRKLMNINSVTWKRALSSVNIPHFFGHNEA